MGRRDSPPEQRGGARRVLGQTQSAQRYQQRRKQTATQRLRQTQLRKENERERIQKLIEDRFKSRSFFADTLVGSLRDTAQQARVQATKEEIQNRAALTRQQEDALYTALAARQEEDIPLQDDLTITPEMRAKMREDGALRAQAIQAALKQAAIQRANERAALELQLRIDLSAAEREKALKAQELRNQEVIERYIRDSAESIHRTTLADIAAQLRLISFRQVDSFDATTSASLTILSVEAQVTTNRNLVNAYTKEIADGILSRAFNYDTIVQQQADSYAQSTLLAARVAALTAELSRAEAQRINLEGSVTTIGTQLEAKRERLRVLTQELSNITVQLQPLLPIDAGLRERLTTRQREVNEAIAELEGQITKTQGDLTRLTTVVIPNALAQKNAAIRTKAEALATAVSLSQADIASLSQFLTGAEARFRAAETMANTTIDGARRANRSQHRDATREWETTRDQHLTRLEGGLETYVRETVNPATTALRDAKTDLGDAATAFSREERFNRTIQENLTTIQTEIDQSVPLDPATVANLKLQIDTLVARLNSFPLETARLQGLVEGAKQAVDAFSPSIAPTSAAAQSVKNTFDAAQTADTAYVASSTSLNNLLQGIRDRVALEQRLEQQRLQFLADRQLPRAAIKLLFSAQQSFNGQQAAAKRQEKAAALSQATQAKGIAVSALPAIASGRTTLAAKEQEVAQLGESVDAIDARINAELPKLANSAYQLLTQSAIPTKQFSIQLSEFSVKTSAESRARLADALGLARSTRESRESRLRVATSQRDSLATQQDLFVAANAGLSQSKADAMDRISIQGFRMAAYALYTTTRTTSVAFQSANQQDKTSAQIDKDTSRAVADSAKQAISMTTIQLLQQTLDTATVAKTQATTALQGLTDTTIPIATGALETASETFAGLVAPSRPVLPSLEGNESVAAELRVSLDTLQTTQINPKQQEVDAANGAMDTTVAEQTVTAGSLKTVLDGRARDSSALDVARAALPGKQAATAAALATLQGAEAARPTLVSGPEAAANLAKAEDTLATARALLPNAEQAVETAQTDYTAASDDLAANTATLVSKDAAVAVLKDSLAQQYPGLELTVTAKTGADTAGREAYSILLNLGTSPTIPTKADLLLQLEQADSTLSQSMIAALQSVNQAKRTDAAITLKVETIEAQSQLVVSLQESIPGAEAAMEDAQGTLAATSYAWDSADIQIQTKDAERTELIEANERDTATRTGLQGLITQGHANALAVAQATRSAFLSAMGASKTSRLAANQTKVDSTVDSIQYKPDAKVNTMVSTRDGKEQEVSLLDTSALDSLISLWGQKKSSALVVKNDQANTLQLIITNSDNTKTYITADSSLAARLQQELDSTAAAKRLIDGKFTTSNAEVAATFKLVTEASQDLAELTTTRLANLNSLTSLLRQYSTAQALSESARQQHLAAIAARDGLSASVTLSQEQALANSLESARRLQEATEAYERANTDIAAIDTSLFVSDSFKGDTRGTALDSRLNGLATLLEGQRQELARLVNTLDGLKRTELAQRESLPTSPTMPLRDSLLLEKDAQLRKQLDDLEVAITTTRDNLQAIEVAIRERGEMVPKLETDLNANLSLLNNLAEALRIARENRAKASTALATARSSVATNTSLRTTYTQVNSSLYSLKIVLDGYKTTLLSRNTQRSYLMGLADSFRQAMRMNQTTKDGNKVSKDTSSRDTTKIKTESIKLELDTILYLQRLVAQRIQQRTELELTLNKVENEAELARNLRDKAQLEKLNDILGRLRDAMIKVQTTQRLVDENEARIRTLKLRISLLEKNELANRLELERLRKELELRIRLRLELQVRLREAKKELQDLRNELNRLIKENSALDSWKKSFKLPGAQIPIVQILAGIAGVGALAAGIGIPGLFTPNLSVKEEDEEEDENCAAARQQGYRDGLALGRKNGFARGKLDARRHYLAERQRYMGDEGEEEVEPEVEEIEPEVEEIEPDAELPEEGAETPEEVGPENADEQQGGAEEPLEEMRPEEEAEEPIEEETEPEEEIPEEEELEEEPDELYAPFNPNEPPIPPDDVPADAKQVASVVVPASIKESCRNAYTAGFREGYERGVEGSYMSGWAAFTPSAEFGAQELSEEQEKPVEVVEEPEPEEEIPEDEWKDVNGEAEPTPE